METDGAVWVRVLAGNVMLCSWERDTSDPVGGYSQKRWVGRCGPLPKTLTLCMSEICDIPYPIYDLFIKSKPCYGPAI